jgi:aerobic C4-dicarboxylate transport protein
LAGKELMALAGLNIVKFLNYLREELTIVLATTSSDAVLPQIMRKLKRMASRTRWSGWLNE